MGKYFGTDGFRGEANIDLNYEHAIKIGRFLGWYYGPRLDKKAKGIIADGDPRVLRDSAPDDYVRAFLNRDGMMA